MNRYYVEVEGFYVEADTLDEAYKKAHEVAEVYPPKKQRIDSIILWDEDIGIKL